MADFNILLHHTMGAHTPMQVTLDLPGEQLLETRIRLPKTLNQFELTWEEVQAQCALLDEPSEIQAKFEEWGRCDPDDAFKWWSQQFETAVDQALRHRADPRKGDFLPTAHKGRGNTPTFYSLPLSSSVRFPPNSIYHPSCEAFTVALRHKVKQIRRAQSLYRRLFRWEQDYATDPFSGDSARAKQVQQEWRAILNAVGYPPSSLEWLHNSVEDYTLQPSSATLTNIVDALITDCKEEEGRAKKKQEKYFRVTVYQDVRQHKSFCYKLIRPPSAPPMTGVEVQRTIRLEFSHLAEGGHQVFTTPDMALLDTGQPLQLGRQSTAFRMKGPGRDLIEVSEPIPEDSTSATQMTTLQQPSEVTEHIAGFWNQYWQRDDAEAHPDEEALSYVERYIPQHDDLGIPHWLPHQWEAYQRKLKPTSARGWCGFGPEDVKLVPWALLHLLSLFMATWTRWPEALRTAKTVMLPTGMYTGTDTPHHGLQYFIQNVGLGQCQRSPCATWKPTTAHAYRGYPPTKHLHGHYGNPDKHRAGAATRRGALRYGPGY